MFFFDKDDTVESSLSKMKLCLDSKLKLVHVSYDDFIDSLINTKDYRLMERDCFGLQGEINSLDHVVWEAYKFIKTTCK